MSGGHMCYAFTKPAALKKIARIIELLTAKPMTVFELAEAVSLSVRTLVAYLSYLRGDTRSDGLRGPRRVRLCEWRAREDGHYDVLYAVGTKPDAKRPAKRDAAERRRDKRNLLALHDPDELLRRRRARQAKRRKPRRDPMITAFFGAAPA